LAAKKEAKKEKKRIKDGFSLLLLGWLSLWALSAICTD